MLEKCYNHRFVRRKDDFGSYVECKNCGHTQDKSARLPKRSPVKVDKPALT